ncbi:hypothetical protein BH11PLA2_BH11PLA2_01370 [soil metagenome]
MMLASGLMKTINLLILLGNLLLVLILLNAWLACAATRNVRVERLRRGLLFAGQPGKTVLNVRNDGTRTTSVSVIEAWPGQRCDCFVPGLLGGTERSIVVEWPPMSRGVYPLEPLVVGSGYPFGFVSYRRQVSDASERVVFPALGQIDLARFRRWLIRTGAGDAVGRRPVARQSPHRADVRGVRTYRSGDNPKHIHWRTTARRNELMVREYDGPEPLDLVMVVEATQDSEHFEAAISLAATIVEAWCRAEGSSNVTLALAGSPELVTGRGVPGFIPKVLLPLARLTNDVSSRELPAGLARCCTSRSVRLLVSSRNEDGPLPDRMNHLGAGAFVRVTPDQNWPWYEPPVQL